MRKWTKSKWYKVMICYLLVSMVAQWVAPLSVYALTNGPTAPEAQGFVPSESTDMVNLFTGDFNYNLPLFQLPGPNGGYPFNLSYAAGVNMEQEASWVGLGWNLSPGLISRELRGLPDEFNGDDIIVRQNMKKNATTGAKLNFNYELFGGDFDKGIGLSFGVHLYHNTYRGFGMGTSVGVDYHPANGDKATGSIGLNMSMDSQEGVGLNPQVSITSQAEGKEGDRTSLTLAVGYNTKRGLTDLGFGITASKQKATIDGKEVFAGNEDKDKPTLRSKEFISGGVSFAHSAYSPSVGMEMEGYNLTFTLKLGGEIIANHLNGDITAYHTEQTVLNGNRDQIRKGYGFLHSDEGLQYDNNGSGDKCLFDINREKDGVVRKEMPNLGIPSHTHDLYNVSGQSVGGTFRPYRSSIALLADPRAQSVISGGAVDLNIGGGNLAKVGGGFSVNVTKSRSGLWAEGNDLSTYASSINGRWLKDYEPYYFKFTGDPSSVKSSSDLDGKATTSIEAGFNYQSSNERMPRANSIQEYYNFELYATRGGDTKILPEYDFEYTVLGGTQQKLNRSYYKNHIGGFTVLQASGQRYVYGLPVYNKSHEDWVYTAPYRPNNTAMDVLPSSSQANAYHIIKGTDQYLSKTILPGFATAHLLTAVLGDDYIDVDGNGPSDNDFGYWVKFNYTKTEDLNWKTPYLGAQYIQARPYPKNDDKAAFQYGTKENFYLTSSETKTHKAIFNISKRADAKGITGKFSDQSSPSGASYKLDKILLYSKEELAKSSDPKPISVVNFEYTYELCQGIPNFNGNDRGTLSSDVWVNNKNGSGAFDKTSGGQPRFGTGKLTLKKVWFTYERSNRGALNPYEFFYGNRESANNPNYNKFNMDRWGMVKDATSAFTAEKAENDFDNPYTDQTGSGPNVLCWNLTSINTPTGSEIKVGYEPDDYGYVQNKVAGQMFRIDHLEKDVNDHPGERGWVHDYGYDGVQGKHSTCENIDQLKVYFKLDPNFNTMADLPKYFESLKIPNQPEYQLYFKVLTQLRSISEPTFKDYISGYATFTPKIAISGQPTIYNYGIDPNDPNVGWIRLNWPQISGDDRHYHPFALAAWQYMRTNYPEYCSTPGKLATQAGEDMKPKDKAKEIAGMFTQIRDIFTKYYYRAAVDGWARKIDCDHSFIRLATPGLKKYGGGHRVNQITITNPWDTEIEGATDATTYGIKYNYTTSASDGSTISSGVAQYEPSVGGDEISLRYCKTYPEKIPLKTPNSLYFEYPVNEAYFPAPVVGYSKVTVMSLAAAMVANHVLNSSVPTTGQAVHEFYTAKDFPVLTGETSIEMSNTEPYNLVIPLPFLGSISIDRLQAKQGYYVELNDMHGKQKKVSFYRHKQDGTIETDPNKLVSSLEYVYQTESQDETANGFTAKKLNSKVQVMRKEGDIEATGNEMGVDYETFTDRRWSYSRSGNGGLSINADPFIIGPIPVPAVVPWPSISYSESEVKLAVTNKIIHRTGILQKTIAYTGESRVESENLAYDAVSGRPVLSKVNNNYDDPVYSYHIPAYWEYEGMGPAYQNFGLVGEGSEATIVSDGETQVNITGYETLLNPGDELLLTNYPSIPLPQSSKIHGYLNNTLSGFTKATVQSIDGTNAILTQPIYTTNTIPTGQFLFRIIRSGKRNLLNADAGSITALKNPMIRSFTNTCSNSGVFSGVKYIKPDLSKALQLPQAFVDVLNCKLQDFKAQNQNPYIPCTYLNFFTSAWTSFSFNDNCDNQHLLYNWLYNTYFQFIPPNSKQAMEISHCDPSNGYHIISQTIYDLDTAKLKLYHGCHDFLFCGFSNNCNSPIDHVQLNSTSTQLDIYLTNGAILHSNPIYSPTYEDQGCLPPPPEITESPFSESCGLNTSIYKIDKVLAISSTKYNLNFPQDFCQLRTVLTSDYASVKQKLVNTKDKFSSGEASIWRPIENYTYLDIRQRAVNDGINSSFDTRLLGSTTTNNPINFTKVNLRKDGVYDNVPLFDWHNPYFPDCYPRWKKVNTITAHNHYANELENEDVLGSKSSALYSYKGKLSVGIATNAGKDEIATEGFEEYTSMPIGRNQSSTANFTFLNSLNDINVKYDKYSVVFGKGNMAAINIDYNDFISKYPLAMSGSDFSGKLLKIVANATGADNLPVESSLSESPANILKANVNNQANKVVLEFNTDKPSFSKGHDRCWVGDIYIPHSNQFNKQYLGISFVNNKAHTGKTSMLVSSSTTIPQLDLKLLGNGKKYVVSAWISISDIQNKTSTDIRDMINTSGWGIRLGYAPPGQIPSGWQTVKDVTTSIIDGWVKIESDNFTVTGNDGDLLYIQLNPLSDLQNHKLYPVYIDDIRLHPFDANMKTYVYDPQNYKLRAELDYNNFGTLYSYDDQGKLFLIRKETERGIMTVQETRSNLKEKQ